ncbi:formylglycine-generating enzyme family protein [Massilia norwichensis]|uniref:Formylglycine-generating enzyme family protein n=1 Tax=Massilia norwichensis TaxID=1442366 RepID=A0ABT2ABS5_9BURK|nr:formylglycine-generating enzyme family protein [Massilia norwichensis]MCS0591649.1 formylglycine-generating enzyme family protein [Massilia norwichensis]
MKNSFVFIGALAVIASLQSTAVWAEPGPKTGPSTPNVDLDGRIKALVVKVKASLRPLKGGTFEMGDWGTASGQHYDLDTWSRPLHKVTLDGFSMMAYKVAYEDFDVFTDATGNERINMDKLSIKDRQPRRPAGVSWYGAKAYCQWLGKITGMPFDLPTEAQWEYAARSGGTRVLFSTDNGKIERPRNFPKDWRHEAKQPPPPEIGSYPANPAGLYGMSEDNGEWVNDWFDEDYYKKSPEFNPAGPATGSKKVLRGSVGGIAEMSAMVFMRASADPQPKHDTYPNGFDDEKRIEVPFPGYSGYKSDNFRCVSNSIQKLIK